MIETATPSVAFTFGACDPSVVIRSVVAAVDHLCGDADVNIGLLDALEVPLAETLLALYPAGIIRTEVAIEDDTLVVGIWCRDALTVEPAELLGVERELVESFFVVEHTGESNSVALTGSLR